ncbi:MAG: alpha/beta hydrolase [Rhodobacteraceae bacterium]|nr:alpha/beta hydrolase [Paracoccaceae bacterium]
MKFVESAGNPVPEGAQIGYFESPQDGTRSRYALWPALKPARKGSKKGCICLFPGRGEFIEKYFETVTELLDRGFSVAMLDWRGQGRSQRPLKNPRKGHVVSFEEYSEDLEFFMKTIVEPECPWPYFALAFSMGGNVILRALPHKDWFQRVVLVSPMVGLSPHLVTFEMLRFIVKLANFIGLGTAYIPGGRSRPTEERKFAGNLLTTDSKRLQRVKDILRSDPALGLGSPTFGWMYAAMESISVLQREGFGARISTPTLIIAGGHERVVSYRAIETLCRKMPKGALVTIDGALHEIMMERDIFREQFWAAFDAFIPGSAGS